MVSSIKHPDGELPCRRPALDFISAPPVKRLHLVGCPRSGTTLMMELMKTCFKHDACCEHEESLFHEPSGNPGLYFSKQPTDIRYLHRVFLRDPNLFVVNLLRDPRDVISSRHQSKPGL